MQRKYGNWKPRFAGLLLVVATVGCGGPSLTPVKGVVKVDGKPAKGVVLTFIKVGAGISDIPSSAVTEDGGTFSLRTGEKEGAEPGKYKVTATWPDPSKIPTIQEQMMGASPYDGPDLLNGKYVHGKSTVEVEVKSGSTEIAPIELTP